MRLGGALICAAVLASWLALSPHGGSQGTAEGERASTSGDSTYRNRAAGVEASIPRGWRIISRPVTAVTYPKQVLMATSFPAVPPRSPRGCKPNLILKQMPRHGAYVFVLEYSAEHRVPKLPRKPPRLRYSDGRFGNFECGGRGYVFDFSVGGRAFQADVVMNPEVVDPTVRAQALSILNGFHPQAAASTVERWTLLDTAEVGRMEWTCSGARGRLRFILTARGRSSRIGVRVGPGLYAKAWLQPGSGIQQPVGSLPQRWRIEPISEALPPIGVFRVLPGPTPCARPSVTHHREPHDTS